jgi:hypothetical protein
MKDFYPEIFEMYKEEFSINLSEGLIKSVKLEIAFNLLSKNFKDYIISNIENSKISIEISEYDEKQFSLLLSYLNSLGYFITRESVHLQNGRTLLSKEFDASLITNNLNDISSIVLYIEPKYDIKIERVPKVLYHATPNRNSDKILQTGLTPKSRSKLAFHPERVYLTDTVENAKDISKKLSAITGEKGWSILKIETQHIPPYFKLYKDPNYTNGYYSVNNIPPSAITKLEDYDN